MNAIARYDTTRRRRSAAAFTLVELLVVVSIIALLLGVLLPTFGQARKIAQNSATQSRVMGLSHGCEMFYQDYRYYPGQDKITKSRLRPIPINPLSNHLVGAQVLTMEMFGFDVTTDANDPTKKYDGDGREVDHWCRRSRPKMYVEFEPGDLDTVGDKTVRDPKINGFWPYTILDEFTDSKPILYYPSTPGAHGLLSIYKASENLPWMSDDMLAQDWFKFRKFIANPTYGNPEELEVQENSASPWNKDVIPFRPKSFLIIGAGKDGEYFTDDDNLNFNRQ